MPDAGRLATLRAALGFLQLEPREPERGDAPPMIAAIYARESTEHEEGLGR